MNFPQYVKVKDKYCCFYLGESPEYVVALKLLKPQIEKKFPKINFYIGCREEFKYLLDGEKAVFGPDPYKFKDEFAHIREIRNDHQKHSVLNFVEESIIIEPIFSDRPTTSKGLCIICPEGVPPAPSLITKSKFKFNWEWEVGKEGYAGIVLGSDIHATISDIKLRPSGEQKINYIREATWVMGVENEYTMLAAAMGKKVTLMKTGVGKELYKKMFPKIEIM